MSEWIKVDERMPASNTRVLVYEGDVFCASWKVNIRGDEWWEDTESGNVYHYVTHWQPLPAPPVSDSDTPD